MDVSPSLTSTKETHLERFQIYLVYKFFVRLAFVLDSLKGFNETW